MPMKLNAKNYTTTQKLKDDLDYEIIRTPLIPITGAELQYCINDVAILSERVIIYGNEIKRKRKSKR